MRNHRWFPAATAIATLAALLLAPNAGATAPVPIPPNPDVTWPAGTVCPYPVRVVATANNSRLHTLRNGQLLITGKLVQRVTNERTGASKTIRASGPLRVIIHDDGSFMLVSHGRILWTFFAQDAGGPGLFVFTGHVVMEVDTDGFATSISRVPKVEDVCAELG
jgi:hypothetical protein